MFPGVFAYDICRKSTLAQTVRQLSISFLKTRTYDLPRRYIDFDLLRLRNLLRRPNLDRRTTRDASNHSKGNFRCRLNTKRVLQLERSSQGRLGSFVVSSTTVGD
jgi:hypothetical protein